MRQQKVWQYGNSGEPRVSPPPEYPGNPMANIQFEGPSSGNTLTDSSIISVPSCNGVTVSQPGDSSTRNSSSTYTG